MRRKYGLRYARYSYQLQYTRYTFVDVEREHDTVARTDVEAWMVSCITYIRARPGGQVWSCTHLTTCMFCPEKATMSCVHELAHVVSYRG